MKAGFQPKQIMMQSGHKTMSTFQRYNILTEGDQAAMVRLQDAMDERLRDEEEKKKLEDEKLTAEVRSDPWDVKT
jgi:hypothetical protein